MSAFRVRRAAGPPRMLGVADRGLESAPSRATAGILSAAACGSLVPSLSASFEMVRSRLLSAPLMSLQQGDVNSIIE